MASLIEQIVVAVSFDAAFALLVEVSLKATLLLGVACLAAAACRRCSAAMRHAVWAAGVSAVMALPVLVCSLPSWNAIPIGARGRHAGETAPAMLPASQSRHVSPELAPTTAQDVRPSADGPNERAMQPPRSEFQPTTAAGDSPSNSVDRSTFAASTPNLRRWAIISWFAVANLLALRLAVSWLRLRQLARRCRPVTGDSVLTEFTSVCDDLRLRRRVACCVAPIATAPLATGILRPRVILPPASHEWSREQLRSVLVHELAHIRRHDCLTQLVANLAAALYWFNPLVWLAARRMQVERESACDDAVLRHGVAPTRYAEQLFSVATGLEYRRVLAATSAAMARPSRLECRLQGIMLAARNRRPLSTRQWSAILSVSLIVAVSTTVLGAQSNERNSAEPSRLQAAESDGRDGIEQLTPTPEHYYEDPLPPGAVARLGTERFRLTGWHKSLEFTSDGRKLLAASADETIIPMWNPRTGELLGEILTDPYPVRFMQVLSDGKTLITYGYHYPPGTRQLSPGERAPHRVIQIWDLEKGVLRSIVEPNLERNEEVRSLVVTPDDNSVALGTGMGDIRVLAIPSGKERFRRNFGLQGVETLAISSDGQLLAAGVGNDVYLWRWFDGNEPEKVFESKNHVTCVAFSPDAERLVIAGVAETKLVVWNVARKQIHVNLEVEARRQMYIREMAFANGGQLLLATNANTGPSSEPGVLMWNTVTGKYIRRFDLGGHTTSALAVSPDGQLLAAIGDSTCVVWELRTGKKLSGGLVGHQDSIGAVSRFSHDGTIVTADDVGTVRLWDTGSGRQIRIWDHGSRVGAVDISPDGEWIASSGDDIRIWNAKTGDEEFRVAGQRLSPRKAIAFTRDYQRLVSWGDDGFVQIWDTAAGKLLAEHSVDLISLGEQVDERYQHRETFSLASDARHFCLANGAKLHIFNTETGERIEKQELGLIDGYRSHELQLSPNGAKVFVITADNPAIPDLLTAQLIDLASGEVQWEHKLPLGPCGPSGFSPDGTLVAASVRSNRGALVVWDVATGTERARFESVPKTAWGGLGRKLAISSDNTRLAVAMMDTTTLIWDISQGK